MPHDPSTNELADTDHGVMRKRSNLMQTVFDAIALAGMHGLTINQLEAALPFDRWTIRNALKRLRLGAYLVLVDGREGVLLYCVAGARRPVDRRGRPRKEGRAFHA